VSAVWTGEVDREERKRERKGISRVRVKFCNKIKILSISSVETGVPRGKTSAVSPLLN